MNNAPRVQGRPRPAVARILIIATFLAVAVAGLAPGPVAAQPVKNVLIIHSFTAEYPAYTSFNDGFTGRLHQEQHAFDFHFFYESLDHGGDTLDKSYLPSLLTVLRQKYLTNPPDLVIANGVPTARFILSYGRYIFGNTPVIVTANRQTRLADQPLPANYLHYYPLVDAAKTVQLILSLRPATEKLYIIIGSSEAERKLAGQLPRQLAPFAPRLTITYLDNLTLSALLDRIRHIDSSAAILFVNFIADAEGSMYIPAHLLRTICAEAPVPVFAIADSHLGGGSVGGHMVNLTAFGRQTGEKALAVLRGAPTTGLAEPLAVAEYIFDWRELRRWDIDVGDLPPGSVVRYTPVSFWKANKWYILGSLSVILLQAALLALLMINRRKRLQAEKEVARLDRLHLVGEMAAGISHEIRNPLTAVRGYLQLLAHRPRVPNEGVISTMIGELDRANGIISEFLGLAKNKTIELSPHRIDVLIMSLLPILRSEANLRSHDIQFIPSDTPCVLIDEKEIRQVVLNLVMNAFDAMAEHGVVTIRTGRTKQRVILSVGDTGPGIPPAIAAKIGTPFFTTKATGTGLGLSVCFAIAARHNARLTFDTGPRGTIFHLALPIPPRANDSLLGYPVP